MIRIVTKPLFLMKWNKVEDGLHRTSCGKISVRKEQQTGHWHAYVKNMEYPGDNNEYLLTDIKIWAENYFFFRLDNGL